MKRQEASLLGRYDTQNDSDLQPLISSSAQGTATPVKSSMQFGNGYGRSSRKGRGRSTDKSPSSKRRVSKHVHFR